MTFTSRVLHKKNDFGILLREEDSEAVHLIATYLVKDAASPAAAIPVVQSKMVDSLPQGVHSRHHNETLQDEPDMTPVHDASISFIKQQRALNHTSETVRRIDLPIFQQTGRKQETKDAYQMTLQQLQQAGVIGAAEQKSASDFLETVTRDDVISMPLWTQRAHFSKQFEAGATRRP